jgi:hypothetical protein
MKGNPGSQAGGEAREPTIAVADARGERPARLLGLEVLR